ncbi:MAG: flagellar biosynthetic protein FliR [Acetobacteraceae bacterium]|nr:flagellar biosynthetic protein FliR [Acetobacteraceae bacterium]
MSDAALIAALPGLAFQAILLFARLAAAAMLLPGLGEAEIPPTLRLVLALLLVPLLLPALAPNLPGLPAAPGEAARLLGLEVLLGLWIGLTARVLALALAQAGQVLALLIGLASPLQGDAVLGAAATVPARMLALLTAVLVLASGLYAVPLRALVESYAVLPAGGPLPAGPAAEALAAAAAASLELGLRLAAPFVLAAVLFNFALGLMARLAPQSQVFVVVAPAQLLGGLALLLLLLPAILALWGTEIAAAFLRLPGA